MPFCCHSVPSAICFLVQLRILRCIHADTCNSSYLFSLYIIIFHCMNLPHFVFLFGHLGCLQFFAIINSAVVKNFLYISLYKCARISVEYIPRNGTVSLITSESEHISCYSFIDCLDFLFYENLVISESSQETETTQ